MNSLKIISMLSLIHEENKQLMSMLISMRTFPKEFDRLNDETLKNWDNAFKRIMRMDDEHSERCGDKEVNSSKIHGKFEK